MWFFYTYGCSVERLNGLPLLRVIHVVLIKELFLCIAHLLVVCKKLDVLGLKIKYEDTFKNCIACSTIHETR